MLAYKYSEHIDWTMLSFLFGQLSYLLKYFFDESRVPLKYTFYKHPHTEGWFCHCVSDHFMNIDSPSAGGGGNVTSFNQCSP